MARLTRPNVTALIIGATCAMPAPTQSSLDVYGNLDLGFAKESGSAARLDRGYNNWLGFKGQEDLGGGQYAIFNLQTRFNPDTGQQERPRTFWQGESTVGLKSASIGTLRLGRALSPLWHNVWAFEPWKNSGFNGSLSAYQTGRYSSDGINDAALGFADFSRISNAVFYSTPDLSGLTVHAASQVEKSNGADARTRGVSLNYARSPLATMFAYESNARKDDIYFIAASYQFGSATVMGSYASNKRVNADRERTFVLAGTYAIGSNTVRSGYGRNQENDNDKFSIGYVHSLSKRTRLYADMYRERTTLDERNGFAIGMNHTF